MHVTTLEARQGEGLPWALRWAWREFVWGCHLCSLGAPAVVYVASSMAGATVHPSLMIVAYLCTHAIYLQDRLQGLDLDAPTNCERSLHMRRTLRVSRVVALVFPLAALILTLLERRYLALAWFGGVVATGFLYSKVFKPISRHVPGFKSAFVALEWASLVVLFALYQGVAWCWTLTCAFGFAFLRESVRTSACDMKDLASDRDAGIRSLAVALGPRKLGILLHSLNLLSGLIVVAGVWARALPAFALALLAFVPYGSFAITRSVQVNAPAWVYDVLVDAELSLWPVALLVAEVGATALLAPPH